LLDNCFVHKFNILQHMEATHGEGASLSENPNLFDVFGLKVRKFKTT